MTVFLTPEDSAAVRHPTGQGRRDRLPQLLAILLVCVAVYANALSNDFVYDDSPQVLNNPWIRDFRYLPQIFSSNAWGFYNKLAVTNYYRPLMYVIYSLCYHLFGLAPWGYHLVNVLFHAGNSLLVFMVTSRLLRIPGLNPYPGSKEGEGASRILPFIATLLFATHPIHVEAVTWVAGLPDLSFTFFSLLSFYYFLRWREKDGGSLRFIVLSAGTFFLASLCKETAMTLPAIFLLYDIAAGGGWKNRVMERLKAYLPYIVVAAVYMVIRIHALGGFAPMKKHSELNTYEDVINIFPLFARYLGKLFFPFDLNAFYVLHPVYSIFEPRELISLSVAVIFTVAAIMTWKKNRLAFFCMSLAVLPLGPVLYIPVVGENSFAERYLYLPSVGFAILLSMLVLWAAREIRRERLFAAVSVLLALYCFLTVNRNKVWHSDFTLWSDTVNKSPDAAVAHDFMGLACVRKGMMKEAIDHFQKAVELDPDLATAHDNLGESYVLTGDTDRGIEQLQTAVMLSPGLVDAHINLGMAYWKKGRSADAITQYEAAIRLQPDNAEAYSSLGKIYDRLGNEDMAIDCFNAAARLSPEDAGLRADLAEAYRKKGLNRQ